MRSPHSRLAVFVQFVQIYRSSTLATRVKLSQQHTLLEVSLVFPSPVWPTSHQRNSIFTSFRTNMSLNSHKNCRKNEKRMGLQKTKSVRRNWGCSFAESLLSQKRWQGWKDVTSFSLFMVMPFQDYLKTEDLRHQQQLCNHQFVLPDMEHGCNITYRLEYWVKKSSKNKINSCHSANERCKLKSSLAQWQHNKWDVLHS